MTNMMNGHPFWSRPARTKEYDFGTVTPTEDDKACLLAEAASLVRAAIKAGLIKPNEEQLPQLGARSEWATCKTCNAVWSRTRGTNASQCLVCRIPPATCKACGGTFQPKQRKQLCCSNHCRATLIRMASEVRRAPRVTIVCAACGNTFERTLGDKRKNCSRGCGLRSMALKNKTK